MPPEVKRRTYRSQVREERALATRRRILEAAGRRFLEQGYARATIRQIAEEARVSPDLVFHLFGTKRGLLQEVMKDAADVEDPRRALAGPDPDQLRHEPTQREQVAELAVLVGEQLAQARPLDDMLRTAAVVDPELASLRADLHLEQRRQAMITMTAWIAERGALRQPVVEAAALVWTLTSPEVHHMLVDGWGWSQAQYVDWLRSNLEAALLEENGRGEPPG
jgi:AcrR family transcriptional regulator